MNSFFERAEEILRIATSGSADLGDVLLVLDRRGGFRMLEPAGWSLPALAAEFGADAVYKVERRNSSVRVEGWNSSERCLLQSRTPEDRMRGFHRAPFSPHTVAAQLLPGISSSATALNSSSSAPRI